MAPPTISPHTCSAIIKLVFEYSLKTASSTGGEMFQEEPHRQEYASPLWQDHWMVHGLYQTCVKTVNGLGFTSNHNPDILSYDHPGFLPSFNTAPTPVQWGLRRSGYATAIVWEGCWVIYGPCVIGMEYVMSPGLISNHTPDMLSYHPGFLISKLQNCTSTIRWWSVPWVSASPQTTPQACSVVTLLIWLSFRTAPPPGNEIVHGGHTGLNILHGYGKSVEQCMDHV